MGVKGGTTSNDGSQVAAGTSAAQMSGNKATTTAENTNQNINTNNTGTTTNYGYSSQNTAQNQYGGNNTSNTTAGTAASQEQAANIIAAQNALFGRHAPHLGALDINSYLNPYAAYALQGLNQNLGINDKRLASSNIAQSGGVGGDRRAVSEALNFGQDQLARGQLMSQIYGQAVPIAQQQQGAQYGANQFAYNAPWTQTGQMAGNLAQLQQTLGQTQAGTGTNYNYGNTAVAGTTGNVGTSQNIGSQTADTTKNLTSDVNTNTSQTGSNQGFQVGSNNQTSTMSPFQVGAGLLTSALAFANQGGRIPHKADGGGVDDDMPAPPSLPQVHFANLFAGLPKAGEGNRVPDMSGIKPRDSAPYGGGSPLGALFGESAKGGSSDNPLPGLSAEEYGAGYARGGSTPYGVRGYQTDGRVVDDQGNVIDPRDVIDDSDAINAGHPIRVAPQEETDRAMTAWRQNPGLLPQQSDQSDASSDGALNYTAGSGPYTRRTPASDATASLAPHPESYAEWRQRQSGDSDMTDRYKLPFGLNANKFLLRAGLGILGAGSGSTSNPITALGKGFTGALDANTEEEAARRKDYNSYLADQYRNADFLLKERTLNINENKERFVPAGSMVTSDGEVHPVIMEQNSGVLKDAVTGLPPKPGDKIEAKGVKNSSEVIGNIVKGIESGHQPPTLTGLYGASPAVRSGLEARGFDLAKAQVEWTRAQKQVATLNGPQMTRFVGLASSVDKTIDEANALAEQMKNSGIPLLNKAKLAAYIKLDGNSENGKLATRYLTTINTLKEEFANLANGGYAPTEPAWKLANEQINANYGVQQLGSSLKEIQRLIRYRIQGIPGLGTLGAGAANRYTGSTGENNPAAPSSGPTAVPGSEGFKPPSGAVGRADASGKVWYFDPNTKQPYPGQ